MLQIKKGDTVKVLAGKDKGKIGVVLSSNPTAHTVVVEGVNVITKHVKPRSAQQQGGIIKENGTIEMSNVQIVCPVCGLATRIAISEVDGKKVRTCKKCHASLEVVAKKEEPAKKTVRKKSAKAEEGTEETPAKKTVRKKTAKTETATEQTEAPAKKTVRKKSAKTEENNG